MGRGVSKGGEADGGAEGRAGDKRVTATLHNAFAIRHSTKISNRLYLPKEKMEIIYMTRISLSLFPNKYIFAALSKNKNNVTKMHWAKSKTRRLNAACVFAEPRVGRSHCR